MDTQGAFIGVNETLQQAGHRMRELGVVVLGVRGEDGIAQGTVSSEMIVRMIAAGGDPRYLTVGELTQLVDGLTPPQPAAADCPGQPQVA